MNLRACLLALWLASVPTLAGAAPEAADGVRQRLVEAPVLRGHFEQRKQVRGFRNPLVSRGDFLLVRGRGVAWDTREPFASSTVLTRGRLLSTQPDGRQRVLLDGAASPALAAVNALLMALVAGDIDALASSFRMQETLGEAGAWTLELTPATPELARVFERIELRGDLHVREVEIRERSGDHSLVRFLDLKADPPVPTADEAARFD